MAYEVRIEEAEQDYPEFQFVRALTPSEQKAAFHVRDKDGNDLCLKLISPTHDIDRVNREIESLQEIAHPNVVGLLEYTYSTRPGRRRHYMLEQFVEGTDLTNLLASAPLETSAVLTLFRGILAGLEALRAKEIVHRDLKPANVRVRSDGSPVIIDFGLARRLRASDLTHTAQGAAIGTPAYFAPEQFRGDKRDIDHRTDLFAVGLLLYTALVGEHPFLRHGMGYGELERAICESESHTGSSAFKALPDPLRLVLIRLLAKDRIARPATAAQVSSMLGRVGGVNA